MSRDELPPDAFGRLFDPFIGNRGDVQLVARCFAEGVAAEDFGQAEDMLNCAVDLAEGGVVWLSSPDPRRCRAITRDGRQCAVLPKVDGFCAQHYRKLQRVPGDD